MQAQEKPAVRDERPALFVSENLWIELSEDEILADLLYPAAKL
jgi:hypothetical protein